MRNWLKYIFIPHAGNRYTPHSLQKAALAGMFTLILLSFTVANVQSLVWIASDWMVSTILPAVIVKETNAERATDALPPLRRNATLDAAATLKAQDMAKGQYFAHYSPTGVSPWYWFGQAGYSYVHAGENLAIHFTDSSEVVEAWMNSPTHRANIMNGNYVDIGIGTAEGEFEGFQTVYVVQLFGTPAAPRSVLGESTTPVDTPVQSTPTSTNLQVAPERSSVLAKESQITETVDIIPAKPVPLSNIPETPPQSATSPSTTTDATASSTTMVTDIAVTETGPVLFSDHLSTSTGGVPASLDELPPPLDEDVPTALFALTQPQLVLQVIYVIIGCLVFVSLLLSILIEIRHQAPIQVAYGLLLLLVMGGLFYLHLTLTSGVTIV